MFSVKKCWCLFDVVVRMKQREEKAFIFTVDETIKSFAFLQRLKSKLPVGQLQCVVKVFWLEKKELAYLDEVASGVIKRPHELAVANIENQLSL